MQTMAELILALVVLLSTLVPSEHGSLVCKAAQDAQLRQVLQLECVYSPP